MQQKQVTIESITVTLYAVNDQTITIMNRIIADEGQLTPEHTHYINEETSDAETRHDRLAQLYREMQSVSASIEAAKAKLISLE